MVRVRRGTRGKIILFVSDALCIPERKECKRSVSIFNTSAYGFSMATMATLVRLNVALFVHVLLC